MLPSGKTGSIIDVTGVGVGHATVWREEPPPPAGRGVARTGVTVVDVGGNLFRRPVPAGGAVLNGAGECTGLLAAGEWGLAETPVFLTSTMQLGRVYDAACELLMAEEPGIGCDEVIISIVAESRASVGGPAPAEGAVGAGTGMSCLGFKGGIGTASRVVPSGHTVGLLLLSNFGDRRRLPVDGVPVGRLLPRAGAEPGAPPASPRPAGSCIVIVATDAPLDSAACGRLARRAGLGLARTGSTGDHGSGEIFLAMATGLRTARAPAPQSPSAVGEQRPVALTGPALDPLFAAVVEATDEAVRT
jgi:D-aminopeptidase